MNSLCYSITAVAKEEDFGLIRPSLIRQLRAILDQYPDDGQILKVHILCAIFGLSKERPTLGDHPKAHIYEIRQISCETL